MALMIMGEAAEALPAEMQALCGVGTLRPFQQATALHGSFQLCIEPYMSLKGEAAKTVIPS